MCLFHCVFVRMPPKTVFRDSLQLLEVSVKGVGALLLEEAQLVRDQRGVGVRIFTSSFLDLHDQNVFSSFQILVGHTGFFLRCCALQIEYTEVMIRLKVPF